MSRSTPVILESKKSRLEGLSDGVFAIVLTLLVLDLLPGHEAVPPSQLLAQWPAYLAYLASFFTTAAIWISHHQTVLRIRRADTRVIVLNVALLLGVSLVPWPTALIANALQSGSIDEQIAAVAVWAIVFAIIGVPWGGLCAYLARQNDLATPENRKWLRRNAWAAAGCVAVALVGLATAFAAPVAALVIFLLVPAAYMALGLIRPE